MIYIFVVLLINNNILIGYNKEPITDLYDINKNDVDESNFIELIEVIKTEDMMDIDKIVKKYMLKYGIDKVRGGSYNKPILDDWMIKSLQNELNLLDVEKSVSSLDNYINSFLNLSDIDKELSRIIDLRQELFKLKQNVSNTDINIDIDSFTVNYNKYNRRNELQKEMQKYNHRHINIDSSIKNKLIKYELEIKQLNAFLNKDNTERSTIESYIIQNIGEITNRYNNYINIYESDILIQLYSIKIYNIEQKLKLKAFNEKNGIDEELLEKHKALLKKKMEIIFK